MDKQFQSTHPRGVRLASESAAENSAEFQSTHPRGVRRYRSAQVGAGRIVSIHAPAWGATSLSLNTIYLPFCFNPRTRVGCDVEFAAYIDPIVIVSIHAPAWGATDGVQLFRCRRHVSIHAPAWGATLVSALVLVMEQPFQSTHPRGVRLCGDSLSFDNMAVSIHAPAWGATTSINEHEFSNAPVSIHAPAWGATSSRDRSSRA